MDQKTEKTFRKRLRDHKKKQGNLLTKEGNPEAACPGLHILQGQRCDLRLCSLSPEPAPSLVPLITEIMYIHLEKLEIQKRMQGKQDHHGYS